ncbi:zinc transporter ZntB [Emcibacter nanhaiensis]|uniref:Zinc transporter ZntB n=1 Tax=Emcibacter nanhaiensis TaxID=1505037 RepID=A0A501PC63_9PROT|nr:zinc transporter ZntB [Emcibacter nanhaiensis]TPD57484.1 zinc transporter ZntB [Emcibacter nanhaiensis]
MPQSDSQKNDFILHHVEWALPAAEGEAAPEENKLVWYHLDARKPETFEWLTARPSVDDLTAGILCAEETRPRYLDINNGVILILRGVNLNENADPDDMISIRIYVDRNQIITCQLRNLKTISDVKARFPVDTPPTSSAHFLAHLIKALGERMADTLGQLTDITDELEAEVMESPEYDLRNRIIRLRGQAITFRRYLAPQKEAIGRILSNESLVFSSRDRRRFQEGYDQMFRYVEDLDAVRERSQIVQDELSNALAEKLNSKLYLLSVITGIFLPLGFLTGLFGINIGGMPGVDDPSAFWLFLGAMGGIIFIQLLLFKFYKWF